ncbi:hypothetical protein ACL9ST_01705 [Bacillus australimaris]|uniref:hypothetical protein n=1 Tax=Bacillus australimaris TaxID=1326968 RepID=UPI0039B644EF
MKLLIFMSLLIFILSISVIPISSYSLGEFSNFIEILTFFRYDFVFGPIFLFLLAMSKSYQLNAWIILRRFSSRKEIISFRITTVIVYAFLYTLLISTWAIIVTKLASYLHFKGISYTALLNYIPSVESDNFFSGASFFVVFFLITQLMGLVYVFFQELINNKSLVTLFCIFLMIIDRTISGFVSFYLVYGYKQIPFQSVLELSALIFIFFLLTRWMSTSSDFGSLN